MRKTMLAIASMAFTFGTTLTINAQTTGSGAPVGPGPVGGGGTATIPPAIHQFDQFSTQTTYPVFRASRLTGGSGSAVDRYFMYMSPGGQVGLGSNKPTGLLSLYNSYNNKTLLSFNFGTSSTSSFFGVNSSNITYWTSNVIHGSNNNFWFGNPNNKNAVMASLSPTVFRIQSASDGGTVAEFKDAFRVNSSGDVMIGQKEVINSVHSNFKLSVDGKLVAKSIISLNGSSDWADYVFAPDYELMSLPELEKYVTTNRHLPNIPSAEEVKEKGVDVYEMNNKLLEKVEEMTLYIIQMEKNMKKLQERVVQLEDKK